MMIVDGWPTPAAPFLKEATPTSFGQPLQA